MITLSRDSLFATSIFFGGISVISLVLATISAISIPILIDYNEK